MIRDLNVERTKVTNLKIRLNEVYPRIDYLAKRLTSEECQAVEISGDEPDERLRLENQCLRDSMESLRRLLVAREQKVEELEIRLAKVSQKLSSMDVSRSDVGNTVVEDEPASSDTSSVDIITETCPNRASYY